MKVRTEKLLAPVYRMEACRKHSDKKFYDECQKMDNQELATKRIADYETLWGYVQEDMDDYKQSLSKVLGNDIEALAYCPDDYLIERSAIPGDIDIEDIRIEITNALYELNHILDGIKVEYAFLPDDILADLLEGKLKKEDSWKIEDEHKANEVYEYVLPLVEAVLGAFKEIDRIYTGSDTGLVYEKNNFRPWVRRYVRFVPVIA